MQNMYLLDKRNEYIDVIPMNIGYEKCAAGYNIGPFQRDKYCFHYVISGKGIFESHGKIYEVNAGECFCFYKGEKVRYCSDVDEPWEYIWIGFDGTIGKRIEKLPSPIIKYEYPTFIKLYESFQNSSCNRIDATAAALFEIFSHIGNIENTDGAPFRDYVSDVKKCVRNHYADGITVEDIASSVGLNRHYLTSVFKKATGETLIDYLGNVRLESAKELLEKGFSVSESAFMVGYSDQFHFSRMFKRKFGKPPIDFLLR